MDTVDIKNYISSGILENYILNNLSEQERQEVECMSHIYPEIKLELTNLQDGIEQLATQYAVTPPSELKVKILDLIAQTDQLPKETKEEQVEKITEEIETKVVNLQSKNIWKYAAAASILIAAGTVFLTIKNTEQFNEFKAETAAKTAELKLENKELNTSLASEQIEKSENKILISHLKNPATQTITLAGSDKFPEALATIHWNSNTKETYIELNNFTQPSKKLQYQLWAIVDGKPLDMGVFDLDPNNGIQKTIAVANPQAFAVTLEEYGGKPTPNLNNLVVIGNVGG